jgi:hypothetical protein
MIGLNQDEQLEYAAIHLKKAADAGDPTAPSKIKVFKLEKEVSKIPN